MNALGLLVACIFLLDVVASMFVLRAAILSVPQRTGQLALVWLVPLLGAVVCLVFLAAHAEESKPAGTMDPLRLPADGGSAESPWGSTGICGCGGGGDGGD